MPKFEKDDEVIFNDATGEMRRPLHAIVTEVFEDTEAGEYRYEIQITEDLGDNTFHYFKVEEEEIEPR